jgi:predicted kinase
MIIDKDIKNLNRFKFMDLAEFLATSHKYTRINALEQDVNTNFSSRDFGDFFNNIINDISKTLKDKKNESNRKFCDAAKYAISQFNNKKNIMLNRIENGFIGEHDFIDLSHADIINDRLRITKKPSSYLSDAVQALAYSLFYLGEKKQTRMANVTLNHYMAYTNDLEGLPLVYLYVLHQAITNNNDEITNNIATSKPVMVATGGLSGSGKSRLSREIAPYISPFPGAMILRTDIIRKHLCGVLPHEKLSKEFYTHEYDVKTYEFLFNECKKALAAGIPIIADGVFAQEHERIKAEEIAKEMNVPFYGFWVDAPIEVRAERVMKRKRNPSDIKKRKVLEKQLTYDVGNITWNEIDSSGPREQTIQNALDILLNH